MDGGHVGPHHFRHMGVPPHVPEGADHVALYQKAFQLAAGIDDRELVLRCREQRIHSIGNRGCFRQASHYVPDQETGGNITELRILCFSRGCQIDKDGDEDEHWTVEKPYEAEYEGESLADRCRNLCRPRLWHEESEQSPEDPAAIHREGRNHVEGDKEDVHGRQPRQEAYPRILDPF